jgi:hypothetical protein
MEDPRSTVEAFMASWHEPDAQQRSQSIATLWEEDCVYRNARAEFRGHTGIAEAVAQAHQRFVAEGGYVFRLARLDANHDAVRYTWEMVPASGGEPEAIGTHVVLLGEDGRMRNDHQFTDKPFSA